MPRIHTAHLFQPLDDKLIELLRSLTDEEWHAPTVAKQWCVKDVAAHLLDGNIRQLSLQRDRYFGVPSGEINSYEDLLAFLNKLNADWVHAARRMSPHVLTELLAITGKEFNDYIALMDPNEIALFSVAWAGDDQSLNWFHIAREYTEKWHHQQQIREAVNKPGILTQEFYEPFLQTFMRALPHTYRNTNAYEGTVVKVTITGEGGGDWYLVKKDKWEISDYEYLMPQAHTTIEGSIAWKLFSKSWRKKDAMPYVTIQGNEELGEVVLEMISVMA
jgi:uncharacterized protein (TIGR03083 family)